MPKAPVGVGAIYAAPPKSWAAEFHLTIDVSFFDSLNLSFSNHIHRLVSPRENRRLVGQRSSGLSVGVMSGLLKTPKTPYKLALIQ